MARYEKSQLKWWQKILHLEEWKIVLHTGCGFDETKGGSGLTEWDEVNKAAVIWILDPKKYGEHILPYDFEETLIHELLHIKFSLLQETDGFQDRYVHQLIEELARILRNLTRG